MTTRAVMRVTSHVAAVASFALARAVYRNNDKRGRLKQQINALLQSDITEEKQYAPY